MAEIMVSYVAPNMWYTRAMGLLLTDGNSDEYPHIRRHLKTLGVNWKEVSFGRSGIYFIMPEPETSKLPVWEGAPFLPSSPDGKAGHAIYHVTVWQIIEAFNLSRRGSRA